MTPEQAARDLAEDKMREAIERIAHNARQLRELLDQWIDGPMPEMAASHAAMIHHVSEDLSRSVNELEQIGRS